MDTHSVTTQNNKTERVARNASAIQNWLIDHISEKIHTPPDQIRVDEDFVNLGLSSREAVAMMDELETMVGRPIDPGLIWEYPSIRSLSDYLAPAEKRLVS